MSSLFDDFVVAIEKIVSTLISISAFAHTVAEIKRITQKIAKFFNMASKKAP